MGLLCGYLAATAILAGFVFTVMKRYLPGAILGAADIALTLLSIQGFKEMMISSGKILTPELFGFGYNKPVLAVYVLMLVIGAVYVLVGAHGVIRNHVSSVPA